MTWNCSCGLRNSGLNQQCAGSNQRILGDTEHYQVSSNSPDALMAIVAGVKGMTPQEELFARFYNQEKILVKDMDDSQLRDHRDELSKIAFEAKARLVSADDETRERKAKNGNKQWQLTSIEPDAAATEAINVIKVRKERMSKMDKLKAQLITAGIDEETVKEMIKNLERKATETSIKTVTFNKPTTETSAVQVKTKPEVTPFDTSKLRFGG